MNPFIKISSYGVALQVKKTQIEIITNEDKTNLQTHEIVEWPAILFVLRGRFSEKNKIKNRQLHATKTLKRKANKSTRSRIHSHWTFDYPVLGVIFHQS